MACHLFAILDHLTANLAELKTALAPLALIGGTAVSEARKPASAQRPAKRATSAGRGSVSAKRRTAMRDQGRYMSAIRALSAAQRAQITNLRTAKGAEASTRERVGFTNKVPQSKETGKNTGAPRRTRTLPFRRQRQTCSDSE